MAGKHEPGPSSLPIGSGDAVSKAGHGKIWKSSLQGEAFALLERTKSTQLGFRFSDCLGSLVKTWPIEHEGSYCNNKVLLKVGSPLPCRAYWGHVWGWPGFARHSQLLPRLRDSWAMRQRAPAPHALSRKRSGHILLCREGSKPAPWKRQVK